MQKADSAATFIRGAQGEHSSADSEVERQKKRVESMCACPGLAMDVPSIL